MKTECDKDSWEDIRFDWAFWKYMGLALGCFAGCFLVTIFHVYPVIPFFLVAGAAFWIKALRA